MGQRMTHEQIGCRWCAFQMGHPVRLAFAYRLMLCGLAEWFAYMLLRVLGSVTFCMIVSLDALIGCICKIHLRAEQGQMQYLHPYGNRVVPEYKELYQTKFNIMMSDYVMSATKDPEPVVNLTQMKAALERVYDGGYATGVMKHEKI